MSSTPTNAENANKSEMVGKLNSARELAKKYGMAGHGEKLTTIGGRHVGKTHAALMYETRKRIEAETELQQSQDELARLKRDVARAVEKLDEAILMDHDDWFTQMAIVEEATELIRDSHDNLTDVPHDNLTDGGAE